MTRGHDVVADGWAGATNPHPHPTPHPTPLPTQTHTQKASKTLIFPFSTSAHGQTDGLTDQPKIEREKPEEERETEKKMKNREK